MLARRASSAASAKDFGGASGSCDDFSPRGAKALDDFDCSPVARIHLVSVRPRIDQHAGSAAGIASHAHRWKEELAVFDKLP